MNEKVTFKNLSDRISFIRQDVEKLAARKGNSLADKIIFDSMDSHLSELMAKQVEADNRHPLVDFLELRLKGSEVDYGTVPLEILGVIATNLAALIQRATHKITSGKDSQKVPHDIKSSLNLRLADLSPGSTKLGVTFSTGLAELVETIPSKAVKEIFELLLSQDDTNFMNHVAEIGFNSTLSLKKIIDECDKHHLTFDANWAGPFSDGLRSASIDSNRIKYLVSRLASTTSSNPVTAKMTGELVLLSKYGKLELNVDGERIRANYPLEMLDSIQSKHKVGQAISLMIETVEIHNDRIGLNRKNHSVKSVL
ncbi:hypothetical protein [Erwinia persicina]|uniref:Uncharacterized protein n=1 Tax=Erwinia persicina TaxID=55211 RepID=A0A4U3FKE8_9GAMM|nr:hypothetical protein [Erwinia persicina]TKJ94568.1 hypothetical protein EpCFBP13511_03210 [Erwinia persicina]